MKIPPLDLLVAHHYLFYVARRPIISWPNFQEAKKQEPEYGSWYKTLPSRERAVCDYPPHIRSLAYYMLYKFMEETGEWHQESLPYGWTAEPKEPRR
jgi:hypothetical protein